MQHSFDIDVATKYGIEIAVFLKNLSFWTAYNKANNKHFHQGRHWSYNSLDAFTKLFPYWSKRQVEKLINKLIKLELIVKGNFNDNSYDRTCWYSLTDKGLETAPLPISPNGEMDVTKGKVPFHQTVKCIRTDIKPNIKPNKSVSRVNTQKDQKPPLASVENQSTSYDRTKPGRSTKASALLEEIMRKTIN